MIVSELGLSCERYQPTRAPAGERTITEAQTKQAITHPGEPRDLTGFIGGRNYTIPEEIDFLLYAMKCSGENVILR